MNFSVYLQTKAYQLTYISITLNQMISQIVGSGMLTVGKVMELLTKGQSARPLQG